MVLGGMVAEGWRFMCFSVLFSFCLNDKLVNTKPGVDDGMLFIKRFFNGYTSAANIRNMTTPVNHMCM